MNEHERFIRLRRFGLEYGRDSSMKQLIPQMAALRGIQFEVFAEDFQASLFAGAHVPVGDTFAKRFVALSFDADDVIPRSADNDS